MGERRAGRGLPPRSDRQILDQYDDVALLFELDRGGVTVDPSNRMQLKRLAREDLCLAGFGSGASAVLLPRGQRIVAAARGLLPAPLE